MPDASPTLTSGLSAPVGSPQPIDGQAALSDPWVRSFLSGVGQGLGIKPADGSAPGLPAPPVAPQQAPAAAAPGVTPQGAANSTINQLYAMVLPREASDDTSVSPKGAIGKGQVLPTTAAPYLFPGQDPSDPKVQAAAKQALFNPKTNELVSKAYLNTLNNRYHGDHDAVLVAYNAGPDVADKWLASGKDPSVLPSETQHYIGVPLSEQWGKLTPQEQALMDQRTAATQNAMQGLNGLMQQYARDAAQAPYGSQERDALISQYRQSLDQMQAEWRQKVANPPVQKPISLWQAFGSPAMILALLGGLFSRQHLTMALNAAGSVLNGIAENDHDQYQRSYNIWKSQTELGLQMISMENEDIRSLLEDQRMAVDEKNNRLQTLAAEMGFVKGAAGMQIDNIDTAAKFLGDRERAMQAAQVHADSIQQHYDSMALAHSDRIAAIQARTQATAGTPESIDSTAKAIANYQMAPLSSWVMRGLYGQAVMARVLQLNPDYQATEYAARSSGARAFATGRQGDTVRSMSVVIDHLSTLEDLGTALQNGDARRLNQLSNTLATEFGFDGPVDFNAAKQIVGDEIAKAVIGGANAEGDRKALHDSLDAANSPAQLVGVVRTFKRLLAGQLGGLRQQYEGATGKTSADFDQLLSPRARAELGTGAPPTAAVSYLRQHPELRDQFDAKYGAGAASRALGQ